MAPLCRVCLCILVLGNKFVFSGFLQFGRCVRVFEAEAADTNNIIYPSSASCSRAVELTVHDDAQHRFSALPARCTAWPVRCALDQFTRLT